MNHQFDELTKSLAQSVTRRAALKKFGLGLAGLALAAFGLEKKVEAGQGACQACRNSCFDYYQSQGLSRKDAAPLCDIQCALPCSKKPF